ncbi:unnamed protein product [Anisakis simplex]|uniref:DUF630 domain-containing protein n=1 Tax=Anisakis simplex TaxID=6269 RepID=A0A0M3JCF5_ANISI|nr:unnamed protein product [Anisakis simplex]
MLSIAQQLQQQQQKFAYYYRLYPQQYFVLCPSQPHDDGVPKNKSNDNGLLRSRRIQAKSDGITNAIIQYSREIYEGCHSRESVTATQRTEWNFLDEWCKLIAKKNETSRNERPKVSWTLPNSSASSFLVYSGDSTSISSSPSQKATTDGDTNRQHEMISKCKNFASKLADISGFAEKAYCFDMAASGDNIHRNYKCSLTNAYCCCGDIFVRNICEEDTNCVHRIRVASPVSEGLNRFVLVACN